MDLAKIERELSLCNYKLNLLRADGEKRKSTEQVNKRPVVNNAEFIKLLQLGCNPTNTAMALIMYWESDFYFKHFDGIVGSLESYNNRDIMGVDEFETIKSELDSVRTLADFKAKVFTPPMSPAPKKRITRDQRMSVVDKLVALGQSIAFPAAGAP